eukprot:374487_1
MYPMYSNSYYNAPYESYYLDSYSEKTQKQYNRRSYFDYMNSYQYSSTYYTNDPNQYSVHVSRKMSSKIYQLKDILNELEFDKVSIYSVTSHEIADNMTDILLKCWNYYFKHDEELHILDGMACVGLGNTFSFLSVLCDKYNKYNIYINEHDMKRYKMLKNNINTLIENNYIDYNNENHNIFLYNYNINKLHYYLDYDFKLTLINIIFLDPEWGGKHYKNKSKLRLKIGNMNIEKNINWLFRCYKNLKIIAIKLPLNYDWKHFKENVNKLKWLLLMQINFVNQSLMLCIKCDNKKQFQAAYNPKFCSRIANTTLPQNIRIL